MDLLHKHKSLTLKHRSIVLNWMMEVVDCYDLKYNTYQVAVYILDKYMITENVNILPRELQGISVVCITIASKLVDENLLSISDADYISQNQYGNQFLVQKEKQIIEKLGYRLYHETVWQLIKKNGERIGPDVFRIAYYLTSIMLIHPEYIFIPTKVLTDKIIKFAITIKKNHHRIPKMSKKDPVFKYLYCMWSVATINTKFSEIKNIFVDLKIYYVLKKNLLQIGPIFEGNVANKYGNQLEIISDMNICCNKKYYNSKVYEIDHGVGIPKEALKEIVALVSVKKHSNIASLDSYNYDITSNKLTYGSKIVCSVLDKLSQNPTKKFKLKIIKQFLLGIKHLCDNQIVYNDLTIDKLFLDKNNDLIISACLNIFTYDLHSSNKFLRAYKGTQNEKKYIKSCGYIIGHILLGHSLLNDKNEIQYKELDERYPEILNLLPKMISPDLFINSNIDNIIKVFNSMKSVKINSF
uniref:Cyclin-domain fused to serine-threonine kinase n=1 Tax=Borely moumouvirus TaxID=2712067 RepID=A0A6G6ADH8_9VIRU